MLNPVPMKSIARDHAVSRCERISGFWNEIKFFLRKKGIMQAQENQAVTSIQYAHSSVTVWVSYSKISPAQNAGQRGFPLSFKPLCLVSTSPIHRRQATIDKAMNWHTVMLGRICLMYSAQLWTITWSPVAPRMPCGPCMCQPVGFGPYKHFQRPDSFGPNQGSTNRVQESL